MKRIISIAGLLAAVASGVMPAMASEPYAGPSASQSPFAVGVGISTLGILGELSMKMAPTFVFRLNGSWGELDHDATVDNNRFSGTLRMWGVGAIGDWHPFANGFRLSGGARYGLGEATGSITGSDVTINGTTYTAAEYGTLRATVESGNRVAPYLGFGWDSTHFSSSNFFLSLDVGALYVGDPSARLTATNAALVPGLQADLDEEVKQIKKDYGKFGQFWPVIALTAKYRF